MLKCTHSSPISLPLPVVHLALPLHRSLSLCTDCSTAAECPRLARQCHTVQYSRHNTASANVCAINISSTEVKRPNPLFAITSHAPGQTVAALEIPFEVDTAVVLTDVTAVTRAPAARHGSGALHPARAHGSLDSRAVRLCVVDFRSCACFGQCAGRGRAHILMACSHEASGHGGSRSRVARAPRH